MISQTNISSPSVEIIYTNDAIGNAVSQVKGSQATCFYIKIQNPNVSDVFLKIFDIVASSVILATTTPESIISAPAGTSTTTLFATASAPGQVFGGGGGPTPGLSIACVTQPGTGGTKSPLLPVKIIVSYQ